MQGWVITIVRKTFPSLRATAYRDFLEVLKENDWYSDEYHNKSDHTYWLFGNLVEFVSCDEPKKVRGRKRDICFINEVNELDYEDFFQLNIRTLVKMIVDYNPSDEFHWVYDKLIPRPDADFFITTYLDNPYLPEELIHEIEMLQGADPEHWKVYGLGQRGTSQNTVFTHWRMVEELPEGGEVIFGQDFGFNNPSALVKVVLHEGCVYAHEMLYQTRLTAVDLVDEYRILGIHRSDIIYCDSASPPIIQELCNAGYNAQSSDKDVLEGISKLKSMPLYVTKSSANLIKELKNYKWRTDKDGNPHVPEQPVKFNDHAIDALRYAVFTYYNTPYAVWDPK